MADEKDGRTQNQPSHDAQVKGGQHSHQSTQGEPETDKKKTTDGRSSNQPSHDASVKGGEQSHSGSKE